MEVIIPVVIVVDAITTAVVIIISQAIAGETAAAQMAVAVGIEIKV